MNYTKSKTLKAKIYEQLQEVKDPEIPFLSIVDLGMITNVSIGADKSATITMTPTFAACPAIDMIRQSIKKKICDQLNELDLSAVNVEVNYDIQWNSNRISEKGKKVLKEFGLAPPPAYDYEVDEFLLEHVACPFCDSTNTDLKSSFGSTLCRSIHYCSDCKQSFEQFKPV